MNILFLLRNSKLNLNRENELRKRKVSKIGKKQSMEFLFFIESWSALLLAPFVGESASYIFPVDEMFCHLVGQICSEVDVSE